tara:strand:+ start:19612 stop:21546 length:1935 start_codon:yes stop_codon:yes gene_type:complete
MYRIIILSFLFVFSSVKAQEIINISGEKIMLEEFLSTLMKNNNNDEITRKYLDEYAQLFINYKLKVTEAKELGLDTTSEFISELEMYRKQLAKPYLQAKDFKESLIVEAYDRMKYDVNASHILFRLDQDANPSDTLESYKLAKKVKYEIESGKISFEDAVIEYSDEKYNNGNLGYFTAFDMVYPFESAVYNTSVGDLSEIIRTKYGYHIILVNDKRPSVGKVKVSHIMIKFPKGADNEIKLSLKPRIDDVYNKLLKGEDFSKLADEYSEDRSTAVNGGSIPWFGINKMAREFETACFSLSNIGDFSEPFSTEYGWHIVILNDRELISTLDVEMDNIKNRIERGSRSLLSDRALLKKIKLDYNFTEHRYINSRKERIKESIDQEKLISALLTLEDIKWNENDNRDLFYISSLSFNQKQFKYFILDYQESGLDFESLYNMFVDYSCLEFEENQLEDKFPEYKSLLNEFRDGILLFDLTSKKVWKKAMNDTIGLQEYFDNNQHNYLWQKRAEVNIYTCADPFVAFNLKKLIWQKNKGIISIEDIKSRLNKESASNLSVVSGVFSKGQNNFLDKVDWNKGVTELRNIGDITVVVEIKDLYEEGPKNINECRGEVISDYQSFLELNWLDELRSKYDVTINKEVLYSIIK